MRLDEDLKDYMSTFEAEYGFKSLSALVNGIFYYAKYQTNPDNLDIRQFLEDILAGELVTPDRVKQKIELQTTQELEIFFTYMDENWGNQMLANFIQRGIRYYLEKSGWLENVRQEFCKMYDIPLYPWEAKKYLHLWYERAEQTGRLREINRCIILRKPLTEQTFLDCNPAEKQGEVK